MIKKTYRLKSVFASAIFLVMVALPVFSQMKSDKMTEITQKFTESVTHLLQEKVYLHTDNSTYLVGETLWFKAYNLDASTHQLSGMSKVLYVELLNDQGTAVKQEAIKLTDGMGDGYLTVTQDLNTGTYKLRAYTSWMKNFDHDLVFNKKLTVINPSTPVPPTRLNAGDSLFLKFFPEGGALINGLSGRLGIRALNSMGQGRVISGKILDDLQTEVTSFTTSESGFTSVSITPQNNRYYSCMIKSETGDTLYFALPRARLDGGVSMKVEARSDGNFEVALQVTNLKNNSFYLVTHTRGILKDIRSLFISGNANFTLSDEILGEGISHLSLLDEEGVKLCERLVFKYPDLKAAIKTDQEIYGIRDKVNISISLLEGQSPAAANVSVAVHKIDSIASGVNSISSNLLLVSDLKDGVENPTYYFNGTERQEVHDLLMMHKWERFSWVDVMQSQNMTISFPPEIRAPLINGRIINNINDYKSLMVSFPGISALVNGLEPSDNGTFSLEIPFRVKKSKLLFWNSEKPLNDSDILLDSPFLEKGDPFMEQINLSPDFKQILENRFVNVQIGYAFPEGSHINGLLPGRSDTFLPFYGNANLTYNLDDYTRFVDMKELFIEYIKSVSIAENDGQQKFHNLFQNQPNLTLLDGIPLANADVALAIDPLKIKTIDIINRQFDMGRINFPGLINFVTYNGDYESLISTERFAEKPYHGIQAPRPFFNPNYSSDSLLSARIPDFRHTLLWKPYVEIGESGTAAITFYTADGEGSYLVEINGISKDGTPVSATKVFEVIAGKD